MKRRPLWELGVALAIVGLAAWLRALAGSPHAEGLFMLAPLILAAWLWPDEL